MLAGFCRFESRTKDLKSSLKRSIALAAAAILASAGYSYAQTVKPGMKFCVQRMGQKEFALLLKDVPDDSKKKLAADTELWKKQIQSMGQLLSLECEAEKRGIAAEPMNAAELANIRTETTATNYDKAVNKGPAAVPFSRITDAQVTAFYKNPVNTAAADKFVKVKLDLMRRSDPRFADRQLTDDEVTEAKNLFAKMRISELQSLKSAAILGPDFKAHNELQVSLQQAQFLARAVSDQLAPGISASDQEIADAVKSHPEFDPTAKKVAAEAILARAKAGEDFAALADQLSQDPGNIQSNGQKNGGQYKDVPKGAMVPPFENAALSLEPGSIYPQVVESDFGFHIIKLEKKTGVGDALKYDVRHILIATTVKDPKDPSAREMPVKEYVRQMIESEKESAVIAKIVAANPVELDYSVAAQPAAPKAVVKKPAGSRPAARKSAVRKRP
jgi:parvulin-like peptidyl-prolyl isomerase